MATDRIHSSVKPLGALLALLVCSYVPTVQLGSVSGVHIDVSILYIALVGIGIYYAPKLWRHRSLVWSYVTWRWLMAFQMYATLSLLWSTNIVRGLITVIFGWLLLLLVTIIIIEKQHLTTNRKTIETWVKIALGVALAVGVWQLVGDAFGVPSWLTLLPAMYSGDTFGFARPTGFALEPQFFGSLLLVPFGVFFYRTLERPTKTDGIWLILVATMLLLTLSRGAILAAVVIALFIVLASRKQRKRVAITGAALLLSMVLATTLVVTAASIRNHSTSAGTTSLTATIEHLSLGRISFVRPAPAAQAPPAVQPTYVQSSTDSRLSMSAVARELWQTAPLFGVGIGGFGAAAHVLSPDYTSSTVANNYYLEMLAELGIIGVGLFVIFLGTVIYGCIKRKQWLCTALLLGALAQWWFFSGNANVIHVWVLMGLAIALPTQIAKKR